MAGVAPRHAAADADDQRCAGGGDRCEDVDSDIEAGVFMAEFRQFTLRTNPAKHTQGVLALASPNLRLSIHTGRISAQPSTAGASKLSVSGWTRLRRIHHAPPEAAHRATMTTATIR
jgi:hypothetical protein